MAILKVRVAGLAPPEGLDIRDLCSKLNRIQEFYQFDYLGSSGSVPEPDLPNNRHSFRQLARTFYKLYPRPEEHAYDVLLTQKRLEEDYFSKPQDKLGLISSSDTELILKQTRRSIDRYFGFLIMDVLGWIQFDAEHDKDEEDVGCLFDGCYESRSTIVDALRECIICNSCLDYLKEQNIPDEQLVAITRVLRWVRRPPMSSYFKWTLSISLLAIGCISILSGLYPEVGTVTLAASGWVAAVANQSWPLLERE